MTICGAVALRRRQAVGARNCAAVFASASGRRGPRRGSYNVAKLMAEHGDAKLTNLLVTLADCPKASSAGVHDRCNALYERLHSKG